jgi:hypothetical protein
MITRVTMRGTVVANGPIRSANPTVPRFPPVWFPPRVARTFVAITLRGYSVTLRSAHVKAIRVLLMSHFYRTDSPAQRGQPRPVVAR